MAAKPSVSVSLHHTSPAVPVASTYTDILDTLKLLEEAPPPLSGSKSVETPPTNQRSKSSGNCLLSSNADHLSSASLGQHNEMGVATISSNLSESKLQSILSYLDEMEHADREMTTQLSHTREGQRAAGIPPEEHRDQVTGLSK